MTHVEDMSTLAPILCTNHQSIPPLKLCELIFLFSAFKSFYFALLCGYYTCEHSRLSCSSCFVFVFARSACLFVIILNSKTTWGLKRLPCNLVAQRLAGDDGHLLTDPLVNMEVVAQTGVVLLDDHPGRLLHCLGPDPPLERGKKQHNHKL